MSGKELLAGMSYVDERFVHEAEHETIRKGSAAPWMKWASLAACLCLIVFSIYHLNQFADLSHAEQLSGEGAADHSPPGQGLEAAEDRQEDMALDPESDFNGEAPSVILRVDALTDWGFVGTVAEQVDTDIFEIGMKLNVVIEDDSRREAANEIPALSEDCKEDCAGTYVMVQFISYDEETGTIVVNVSEQVESPE